MKNNTITKTAVTASLALVLGYVESLIPLPVPVPGIKLGLSNLAVLYALYRLDTKIALGICLIKVVLSSLLFAGFQTFWFSFSGALLSFVVMLILKRVNTFSISGVSIAGGVFHNIGQLIIAVLVLETPGIFYYLPPLLISGAITGMLIGLVCKLIMRHIK